MDHINSLISPIFRSCLKNSYRHNVSRVPIIISSKLDKQCVLCCLARMAFKQSTCFCVSLSYNFMILSRSLEYGHSYLLECFVFFFPTEAVQCISTYTIQMGMKCNKREIGINRATLIGKWVITIACLLNFLLSGLVYKECIIIVYL